MTEESHAAVVTEKDIDKIICHVFLQTLMKRSCIPIEEAQEILDSLGEAAVGRGMVVGSAFTWMWFLSLRVAAPVDLNDVLAWVTMDIAPLGFELKRIKYVVRCLTMVWQDCSLVTVYYGWLHHV